MRYHPHTQPLISSLWNVCDCNCCSDYILCELEACYYIGWLMEFGDNAPKLVFWKRVEFYIVFFPEFAVHFTAHLPRSVLVADGLKSCCWIVNIRDNLVFPSLPVSVFSSLIQDIKNTSLITVNSFLSILTKGEGTSVAPWSMCWGPFQALQEAMVCPGNRGSLLVHSSVMVLVAHRPLGTPVSFLLLGGLQGKQVQIFFFHFSRGACNIIQCDAKVMEYRLFFSKWNNFNHCWNFQRHLLI